MLMVHFELLHVLTLTIVGSATRELSIGALLPTKEAYLHFEKTVSSIDFDVNGERIHFRAVGGVMTMPLQLIRQTCSLLSEGDGNLMTVLVSSSSESTTHPVVCVSLTTSFHSIPTIDLSSRSSHLSNIDYQETHLRIVPPHIQEVLIWFELIREFGWKQICFIRSEGLDSTAILQHFYEAMDKQPLATRVEITLDLVVTADEELFPQLNELVDLLGPILTTETRLILLFVHKALAEHIFAAARKLNLFDAGWAWIVTEQTLQASNLPQGILSARIHHFPELDYITDAVHVATQGIFTSLSHSPELVQSVQTPRSCHEDPLSFGFGSTGSSEGYNWSTFAKDLYRQTSQVILPDGRTGRVEFNGNGDRIGHVYDIVNSQFSHSFSDAPESGGFGSTFKRPELIPVGMFDAHHTFSINTAKVVWPGNLVNVKHRITCSLYDEFGHCRNRTHEHVYVPPPSYAKKSHLKVVGPINYPYIQIRSKSPFEKCYESDIPIEVPCKSIRPKEEPTDHCCFGAWVSLLHVLANQTEFSYELHALSPNERQWSNVLDVLVDGKADVAIGPVRVDVEELRPHIQFSKPFSYSNLLKLAKLDQHGRSCLGLLFQPFDNALWFVIVVLTLVIICTLHILERVSQRITAFCVPCSTSKVTHKKPDHVRNRSNERKFPSTFYLICSILCHFNYGLKKPKSTAGRLLILIWAAFCMITVASFIANLAARLIAIDRIDTQVQNLSSVATVDNSFVKSYLLESMDSKVEINGYATLDEAIEAVRKPDGHTLIWDSMRLKFEATSHCDLVIVGEEFGPMQYGLAMKPGNPRLDELSQVILHLQEDGSMEQIIATWSTFKPSSKCDHHESGTPTLFLSDVSGSFLIILGGILMSSVVLVFEKVHRKYCTRAPVDMS